MKEQMLFKQEDLFRFGTDCLKYAGMPETDANTVTEHLIQTDKWGVHSHGMRNLNHYVRKALAGGVSFTAKPTVCEESPSLMLIDGNSGMGFLSASIAMQRACEMAHNTGVGMVIVRNSCHFGAAGCYSNLAAQQGMVGAAFSNVDRFMTVPGAKGAIMGQNPLSFAAPAESIPSMFLDISTSNAATLKVLNAKKAGERIPIDWIVDRDGRPTADPADFPAEGALQPMGSHKGYGIALFIEVLTGVISGGLLSMSGQIPSWNLKLEQKNGVSHSLLAIDADRLSYPGYTRQRVEEMIGFIHCAKRMNPDEPVTVPGEKAWARSRHADAHGIALPETTIEALEQLTELTTIPLPESV